MIPNQFHFVFGLKRQAAPFHLAYYLCLESCRQVNQPEAIHFYYQHEPYGKYWERIKHQLILRKIEPVAFVEQFAYSDPVVARYRYAHHTDFIRLETLIHEGGIYADIDTIFVNPLPQALFSKSFVLAREDDIYHQTTLQVRPSLCNALIMAAPGAEFGRYWLHAMAGAFDGSWSQHSTLLPYELSLRYPQLIHIEPTRSCYRHMWSKEGLYTLFEGCDPDFTGVMSMHLWSHLWWSHRRREFSDFHAGQLTERYIRTVDMTQRARRKARQVSGVAVIPDKPLNIWLSSCPILHEWVR